jgi:hypothetical protein
LPLLAPNLVLARRRSSAVVGVTVYTAKEYRPIALAAAKPDEKRLAQASCSAIALRTSGRSDIRLRWSIFIAWGIASLVERSLSSPILLADWLIAVAIAAGIAAAMSRLDTSGSTARDNSFR